MTDVAELRRFWYPVAFASALEDGPVARRLLGVDIVIWSAGGATSAALDRCIHRDARLSAGWLADCRLVCPYHGWEYGGDGAALRIPQLRPDAPIPSRAHLGMLNCAVRFGVVWVSLAAEPIGSIPELPEHGADGWRVIPEREWLFNCSAAHLIENNFDPSHVAFVHRGSFGAPEKAEVEPPEVERSSFGFVATSRVRVEGRHGEPGATERLSTSELHLPFVGVIRIGYADGLVHLMFKGCCPIDNDHTRLVQFVIRNDTEQDVPASQILSFDDQVEAEDQALLNTLPTDYPLDLRANVHLKADRSSVELRRLLAQMIDGTWEPAASSR